MKSMSERAQEKRAEKLAMMDEQVKTGALVIRQMTDEERLQYPPRPAPPNGARGSRGRRG
ncbi:MAG TPA: hypothetical protein VHX88_11150 [Solirubrobacteraceae bacterium]|jgi:hypothetical protein|nr:hypothetical protein [Solirubrobacteraceae bacterium]